MAWLSGSGRSGPLFHVSIAGSYPSTLALGVFPLPTPPITQTTPSSTVLATSWRAVGASWTARQPLADLPPAGGTVVAAGGANGRNSFTVVASWWLGTSAPSTAKTVVLMVATARPWRGVRMSGRPDHWPLLMSKDSTVGKTPVALSPPTATMRPPMTEAPQSPRGVGIPASFVHLLADGSYRSRAPTFLLADRSRPPTA